MFAQFGTNDQATRKKRVYYTETASTIYEGMPVCYEFDATTNVLGWSGTAVSSTTAEGGQNEGKFLRVEDPDADNIGAFAGVVARGSHVGQLGGRWLDIYIPNGAIVPVRNDQNCVVGRTILCVNNAEQHLTAPHGDAARPVAIAWETVDTATTTGLVLARLDPNIFIWQRSDGNALLVDDEDTAWQRVNCLQIESAGSQWLEALQVQLDFLAAGTNTGIAIIGEINSYQTASTGNSTAIQGQVYFQSGFVSSAGGYRALGGKIKDEATVTLTGSSLACLYLEHYIRAASTLGDSAMIRCNATPGTNKPTYFIYGQNIESLGYTLGLLTTATKIGDIKIGCQGSLGAGSITTGYIRVYDGVS